MYNLREHLDPDIIPPHFAREYSMNNPHAITCSACGRRMYADTNSFQTYVRSLSYDPSDQFICDDCNDAALDEHR